MPGTTLTAASGQSTTQFSSTADKTVGNSTSEVSGVGTGIGTVTIPANSLVAGQTIRIVGGGIYSTQALTPGNLTVKVKAGSTVLASNVMAILAGAITTAAFDFSSRIAVRATGASGSLMPVGGLNFATSAGARLFADLVNGGTAVTVDTTASQTLDLTFQWQTANASNTLTVKSLQILIS